jgi:large subunit ribosomal protein L28
MALILRGFALSRPPLIPFRPVRFWQFNLEGEPPMASSCDICGKGPSFGNNVSHSQVKTRRRWNPNIQRVKTIVAGASKRQNVCTSCLKAGKVTR